MPRASNGVWTAPLNGWNPAVAGATVRSADWNSFLADLTTTVNQVGYPTTCVAAFAQNVNFNAIADTTLTLVLPSGVTNYFVQGLVIENNGTLANLAGSTARYGLFTAAAGGGTALIASGTVFTGLSSNAINNAGSGVTVAVPGAWNTTPLFFRVTASAGSTSSGNVYLYIQPIP